MFPICNVDQRFRVCGVSVHIRCDDEAAARLLAATFDAFPRDDSAAAPACRYTVSSVRDGGYRVVHNDAAAVVVETGDALLFHLDKDLTLALQARRADLFFMHAAVVADGDRAWAMAAPSGTGKSTTTWALVLHGLRYMSDELAPLDFSGSVTTVHAYPRALNLKHEPPEPYGVPADAMRFPDDLYIPVAATPGIGVLALHGILFLHRRVEFSAPVVQHLALSDAAARVYINALNPLAHPGSGLDAAIAIARRVPCLDVALGPLPASIAAIRSVMCETVG